MALQLRWVGEADMDRVAEVRLRCYAHSLKDIARYRDSIRADRRAISDDYLLAEQEGAAVGTTASLSLQMWVRGAAIPCQGVAYVGTIKTHRRGSKGAGGGIATQLMGETLSRAREREFAATALMPFRSSFYEHFGYGTVETRHNWTLPIPVLPTGSFEGMRYFEPGDRAALESLRQKSVRAGQCDVERPESYWDWILTKAQDGMLIVDRPDAAGPLHGYLWLQHAHEQGKDLLKVQEAASDSTEALKRQLHFLASLRDQYASVSWSFPADFQLNWLLRETQLPHRPVNHPTAELGVVNRLQVRILNQKRFIEPMRLPESMKGRVSVAVTESEGDVSRFAIDASAGHASVTSTQSPADFECSDRVWAAVACGELPATQAMRLGLATASSSRASDFLDGFAAGPRPFCTEAF